MVSVLRIGRVGAAAAAFVAALALLPFVGTLSHELVWDDAYVRAQVQAARDDGGWAGLWRAPFLTDPDVAAVYYRPVVNVSFHLDRTIGNGAPWAYHLTNLLLHALSAVLVLAVARRWFGDDAAAVGAAALFAVLPVHVESVAFASGRADLWAACLALASLASWSAFRSSPPIGHRRLAWWLGSVACYAAACLAKEVAVLLPVVVGAWELATEATPALAAKPRVRRAVAAMLAYVPGLLAAFALRYWAIGFAGAEATGSMLVVADPALAGRAILRMARMLAVPWPHDALYTRERLGLTAATVMIGGAVLAAHAWPGRFRNVATAWIGLPCLAAFLLPSLAVPSTAAIVAAERYLYLPSIGGCLLVGALFSTARTRWPRSSEVLGVGLIAALALACWVRSGVWANNDVLTRELVHRSPGVALAWGMRGQVLLEQRRYGDALDAFDRAVTLEPADAGYHNDAGIALRRLGRPELAVVAFRRSLELNPRAAGVRLNLAYACLSLRDAVCVQEQRAVLARLDPAALAQLEAVLRGGVARVR